MQEKKSAESNAGTGLKDAFKVLSRASQERVQSLTFKMGSSQAEVLVHAMCLICLKKGQEALVKLKTLQDSSLAKHLAEMVKMQSLVDYRMESLNSPDSQVDTLIELARVFSVLAQEKLCSESQRDEAYRVALRASEHNMVGKEESRYGEQLMKEVKEACGAHVVTMGSSEISCPGGRTLKSSLGDNSIFSCGNRGLDRGSTAIPIQGSQCGLSAKGAERSSPSSLRTSSPNEMSFPSHLEVSASPTTEFNLHRINWDMQNLKLIPSQSSKEDISQSLPLAQSESQLRMESSTVLSQNKTENEKDKEDEEEEDEPIFFSFVIFHAPEDLDMAEKLQKKLEGLGIGEGATFSQDFLVPGRSQLKCVEDAIDNSAFTILLLSRNFSNHLHEFQTNSALMNSIQKRHKYNSVIPLLPSKNSMPPEDIPRPLRIYVPLYESGCFDKAARKAFAPEMIRKQKQLWSKDQLIRKQQEKQDRLKEKCERDKILAYEANKTLYLEKMRLYWLQQLLNVPLAHQQPNIHIENASYVMLGNNSQMTVGGGNLCNILIHYREENYILFSV
uniref:TIR domain containing adaptor molecule 1 n=1 Tax=Scleropages formosus TaxID=113540 RepID=A0A8C9RYA0_SCLFO